MHGYTTSAVAGIDAFCHPVLFYKCSKFIYYLNVLKDLFKSFFLDIHIFFRVLSSFEHFYQSQNVFNKLYIFMSF